MENKSEVAVFGGGCFWCTEAVFSQLKGVISVAPGYAGGSTQNPTYEQVCAGNTGHAEVIKVEFDPNVLSYKDLLEVFFELHDPTSLNKQGNDVGTEYRSIVFYSNKKQEQELQEYILKLKDEGKFTRPIVTQVQELKEFFEAEKYHHNFYKENSSAPYCRLVISPKLDHLRIGFPSKIK